VVSGGLPDDVDRDLYDLIAQVMLSAQIPVVLPSLRALLAWDFRRSLKRAQVGLTCICSMDNIAELDLKAFDDLFAIRSIADVGHFLMMENPAAFNRELEFLIDELNEQKR